MKAQYDIVVVGGSSAGSYFAKNMAARGFSVLVLEKSSRDRISAVYDVFHVDRGDFERFDLPRVEEGDGVYCFSFTKSANLSPYGNYPKPTKADNIGMHKHAYICKMNDWAMAAGAEFLYEATFYTLLYQGGRICGLKYLHGGETHTISCRLVVDCSGQKAVVRRSLPASYGVETFALTDADLFFVTLRYIKFKEPLPQKYLESKCWLYYMLWLAPSDDSADGILGNGSCNGYAQGDRLYRQFCKTSPLPAFDIVREEKGTTPYHRALYSFVADGFLVLGDAAAVTKPTCGEGVTAALVAEQFAIEAAAQAMQNGAYPTKQALWAVNKQYNATQGKDFALMMAVFAKALRHSVDANEYMFKNDIIFSEKITGGADDGIALNAADVGKMIWYILAGFAKKELRPGEIGRILSGGLGGLRLAMHYDKFPAAPQGYERWKKKADRLWKKAGKISDPD